MSDPLVEAFASTYGIKNLLEDFDYKKVHRSAGYNYVACCQFHEDGSESFSINTSNGLWKCFACATEGNLYQFLMRHYNCDYHKAKDFIIARAGLGDIDIDDLIFSRDLNQILVPKSVEEEVVWHDFKRAEIEVMYEKSDPYAYLENRGFSSKTMERFEVGFTSKWRGREPKTRALRMEDRITIPGHDEHGKLAGFIGRTPCGDEPKYRYSYGYPKSHTLFNLHRAKNFTDRGLIFVEGSLDVMKIHEFGYPNVVGILGAKLSVVQIELVKAYCDTAYFMFDNDAAGLLANKHAIESLKNSVNCYRIPIFAGYKDPGDLANCSEFEELFALKQDWFAYNLKEV